MMHGILCKMLTDIGIILIIPPIYANIGTGKRKEWALGGAGVRKQPNSIPHFFSRFILHREGCPIFVHSMLIIFVMTLIKLQRIRE